MSTYNLISLLLRETTISIRDSDSSFKVKSVEPYIKLKEHFTKSLTPLFPRIALNRRALYFVNLTHNFTVYLYTRERLLTSRRHLGGSACH